MTEKKDVLLGATGLLAIRRDLFVLGISDSEGVIRTYEVSNPIRLKDGFAFTLIEFDTNKEVANG